MSKQHTVISRLIFIRVHLPLLCLYIRDAFIGNLVLALRVQHVFLWVIDNLGHHHKNVS